MMGALEKKKIFVRVENFLFRSMIKKKMEKKSRKIPPGAGRDCGRVATGVLGGANEFD